MGANLKALIPRTTGYSTEPTVLPTFFVDSSTAIYCGIAGSAANVAVFAYHRARA
jgi:hypothetical protein